MALPENPSADYSGVPQLSGAAVSMVSHSATIELYKDYALVSSVSQIKNNGPAGSVTITVPRGRLGEANSGGAMFPVSGMWVNTPLTFKAGSPTTNMQVGKPFVFSNTVKAMASMVKGGSYALRINYRVPLGRCGFDRKQYLAAYDFGTGPIGVLNVTYKFAKGVVFRLPAPKPDLGWQIGDRGAFLRSENYDGKTGLSYLGFYSGGFDNIGG